MAIKNFLCNFSKKSSFDEESQKLSGKNYPKFLIWLIIILVIVAFIIAFFNDIRDIIIKPSKTEITEIVSTPKNVPEAKVQSAMETPCTAKNNFEESIWEKKDSFRILGRLGDTGEPEFYGAKTEEPFQSQMIYPFDCILPLTATVSAISKSKKSIGLQFEYDGVFQVIVGDGDKRAIRYKVDTSGTRKFGWEYVKNGDKILTHWLPDNDNIKTDSQIDFSVSIRPEGDQIILKCSINYFSEKEKKYKPFDFDPVSFKVESFNPNSSIGRKIRVGINDEKFMGNQAAIKFLQFSLSSSI
jgi:hypothetical protein